MKLSFKNFLIKIRDFFSKETIRRIDINSILLAQLHIARIKELKKVNSLKEVEFKVFSEGGEDGIIQYLLNNIPIENKIFVEFGVQDYRESNTRFLLINDLWKGLVIDSSQEFISYIKKDTIYFKHDLTALKSFITKDNINQLISNEGITGDIGLLSIDIDGNDYWVWNAINTINPAIIICEYNSLFGSEFPVSIPYEPAFSRTEAHFSNLYFGASLSALVTLSEKKGYDFVGSNSTGSNAFFVRKDLSSPFKKYSAKEGYIISSFRQSRDKEGNLNYLNLKESRQIIKMKSVVNTESGETILLKEVFAENLS